MTHEEMIEYRCNINDTNYERLHRLCNDVSKFIEENFSPHTSVIINSDTFVVKEDMLNGYFDLRVKE